MNEMKKFKNIIWLFIIVFSLPCSAKNQVVFTFGKIEVLPANYQNQNWFFLNKGQVLEGKDLLRLPPKSLIRLKSNDGTLLPTLSGGREIKVEALIQEGLQLKNRNGTQNNQGINENLTVDVLPLGNRVKTLPEHTRSDSMNNQNITTEQLEELRLQIHHLPSDFIQLLPKFPVDQDPDHYPSRNLNVARTIYDSIIVGSTFTSRVQKAKLNYSLLYAQLIHYVQIPVDLTTNNSGQLTIIFDSGISSINANMITANKQLIVNQKNQNHIHIPVQVKPGTNFITAWYNGKINK